MTRMSSPGFTKAELVEALSGVAVVMDGERVGTLVTEHQDATRSRGVGGFAAYGVRA